MILRIFSSLIDKFMFRAKCGFLRPTKIGLLFITSILLGNLSLWAGTVPINPTYEKRVYIFLEEKGECGAKPEIDISLPTADQDSKSGRISVKVKLPGFWNEKKKLAEREFDMFEIPEGAWMTDVGHPAIPTLSIEVVIPLRSELIRIDCRSILIKELENIILFPTQESRPIKEKFIIDPVIYDQSEPYPGKYYEITADGFMGERHILVLRLFPIQFTPAVKAVKVYSLDIDIIYSQQ